MKYLQRIILGLGCLFLTSSANGIDSDEIDLLSDTRDVYQARNYFKCPHPFGTFPDSKDCAYYYVCVSGVGVHKRCGWRQHFDVWKRRCMPKSVAICERDRTTSRPPVTATTKIGDDFKCPKFMGSFPHPNDCSKYYDCMFYIPSLKTCPEKQLFDAKASSCKPEKGVNCGTRQKPGYTTTAISTEPTITTISEAISTKDPNESTTKAISTAEVVTESTIEIVETTSLRPTGPPDHNCDEDDVDCIITETGDVEDWFRCPRDVGSFPHPSSDKLFIFCMNWIPSVKKCGMDRAFSKERSTCIEISYFVDRLL